MTRRFRVRDAEAALVDFAATTGRQPLALHSDGVVSLMVGFYRASRPRRVARVDGDGLLWQWGIYDLGQGPEFTFDLTRQLISPGADGAMFQLSVCAYYAASPQLSGVGTGNEWCFDPTEATTFERKIRASPQYQASVALTPLHIQTQFGEV